MTTSLVYLKNKGDHMNHLRVVFQGYKEHQWFSMYIKCDFHIISIEGVEVDPRKTETVKNWPRTLTPIDIRSFLGLVGYYQRFVECFAFIPSPLTTLTHKCMKFE